jgi:hypothetical protein
MHDKPLFLAPAARPGDTIDGDRLGYVTNPNLAMRGEPECIGPAILESYAAVNKLLFTQQHLLDVAAAQERRPAIPPDKRLRDVYRRAKDAHVDLSHEIHLIQRALDKARLRGQPVAQPALDRLEGLEALLDGVAVLRMAA